MAEKVFINGMIAKKPHERAPDFVKANISIKAADFAVFMDEHKKEDGWLNITIKESKGGKFYAELDTWQKGKKPEESPETPGEEIAGEEDIPY